MGADRALKTGAGRGSPLLLLMAITYRMELEMHCDTSSDSDSHHSPNFDLDSAITFDEIRRDDKVVICTQNSEYRFSVIDPQNHKGMLSGGSLGDQPREAFLVESLGKSDSGSLQDFRGLKRGARALFYLSSGHRVERVTTSRISRLTLIRAEDRTSLIS